MKKLMSVKLVSCGVAVGMWCVVLRVCAVCAVCAGCAGRGPWYVESTHIFTLDKDFSKLESDPELTKHVSQVLKRLKTFKVAVHPRIRLFYHLLKRSMVDYAQRTGDSLYMPYVYRKEPY